MEPNPSREATPKRISTSRVIPVERSIIFNVLANPHLHSEIDGSGTVKGKLDGPEALHLGDTFKIKMRTWNIPYQITNTVVEYEEGFLIAWAHFGKHRWRYEFTDSNEGTIVTETFDWETAIWPRMIELGKYPKTHLPRMERTLERLEAYLLRL